MESNRSYRRVFLAMGLICVFLSGCGKRGPLSTPQPSTVATGVSPAIQAEGVATLTRYKPEVVFRRSDELQWQESRPDLPLYVLDAVRTQANASARIDFKKGSRIDMDQNTLVIIRDPEDKGSRADRVVFRGGKLVSRSESELWLLTSAALLKIRASSGDKPAVAKISGEEGRKMRFELSQGEGVLIRRKDARMQSIPLRDFRPVTLDAPIAPPGFGRADEKPLASTRPRQPLVGHREKQVPVNPAPGPAELTVLEPANYEEVRAPTVIVKGRASPADARILVNGLQTSLTNGLFSRVVPIERGENTIVVELVPTSGSPVFRKFSIMRKD